MSASRRRFITFEGSEACGKTTQIALLKERLEGRGERVFLTREPGGTAIGEQIRHLLKHAEEGRGMAAETELLLFSASRAELVRKEIGPALARGEWVLSDRFSDSTTVYQGMGRGLDRKTVDLINRFVTGQLIPGLTLLLHLAPAEARRRIAHRTVFSGEVVDRIEEEDLLFFERVQSGFQELAQENPERIQIVDSTPDAEKVSAAIWEKVIHAFQL